MKIAIVANTSWNVFNFRKGLVHFLIERGYEVTIIAPRDKYTDEIKKWHITYEEIILENKGTNPLADTRFFRKLLHLYNHLKPDIVLHFTIKPNIYGTLACRRLKIPCINNVSGLGTTFIRKSISSRIAHLLYRLAFRFAPKVFFQNEEDLRIFLDKKLVNFSQTGLLPGSGIDLVHFSPTKEQEQTIRKPFVFLMIARLIYDKGLREYVEAAKIVKNLYPDTQIELIGSYEKNTKHLLNITEQEVEQWKE
ncbi:MAG: glycosyltransferase, partial [Thermonemataceae bacterium]|nr:glycosyltransferase [Thermonemataceae bacterium]